MSTGQGITTVFIHVDSKPFHHGCEYDGRNSTKTSSISACYEEHRIIINILAQYVCTASTLIGVNYFMHKM